MGFAETTITDLNRWQFRTVEVLTKLIEEGLKAERPPLNWRVATNGSLVGDVDILRLSNNDRRVVFEEWVRYLDADPWRESERMHGGIHLHATFAIPTNRGDVKGAIRADLDPEGEDQE